MMKIDWQKIKGNLFKDLSPRERDILERRFGLRKKEKETLESIGKSYNICRERVRQIESKALSKIKEKVSGRTYQNIFLVVENFLKERGGFLKKEDLLKELSPGYENHLSFLLRFSEKISLSKETERFLPFYYLKEDDKKKLEKLEKELINLLEKEKKPLAKKDLFEKFRKIEKGLKEKIFSSLLSISKLIDKGPHGLYGKKEWPEISPKGVKDKAYLVLKMEGKPLHFREIATLISAIEGKKNKKVVSATVHNELIKDPRFVLVGRGMYGLREWGLEPGFVRDVIKKVIIESGKPLSKEEIIKKVLAQRIVKENTILLNLQNKNYFIRDKEGKYTIREV